MGAAPANKAAPLPVAEEREEVGSFGD